METALGAMQNRQERAADPGVFWPFFLIDQLFLKELFGLSKDLPTTPIESQTPRLPSETPNDPSVSTRKRRAAEPEPEPVGPFVAIPVLLGLWTATNFPPFFPMENHPFQQAKNSYESEQ
jgi:hypothetical protein